MKSSIKVVYLSLCLLHRALFTLLVTVVVLLVHFTWPTSPLKTFRYVFDNSTHNQTGHLAWKICGSELESESHSSCRLIEDKTFYEGSSTLHKGTSMVLAWWAYTWWFLPCLGSTGMRHSPPFDVNGTNRLCGCTYVLMDLWYSFFLENKLCSNP